ncbi:ribonuclease HII [bacterium]|mgnify:FL=1|jgi:ribonuclease HII|nr:ribonuclease HII [bacterium]
MSLKRFSSKIEIGCDEAGRGSLSGPVVASAVILPKNFKNSDLDDSKKLSLRKREELSEIILEKAISCEIGIVDEKKIDEINILNASILAMHKALKKTQNTFEVILVDGPHFKSYKNHSHNCIIRGDSKYLAIAAASIIAKTYRDKFMRKIHDEFPNYKWCKNKGYPTKEHRLAIKSFGVSKYHRKSFKLIDNQTSLMI